MTLAMDDRQRVAAGRVEKDIACFGCGYNLRGLDRSGGCPECGESIETAVRGDALSLGDRDWLRRLRRGAGMLLAGLACPWLVVGVAVAVMLTWGIGGADDAELAAVAVAALIVLLTPPLVIRGGVLLFSADPRDGDPAGPDSLRRLALFATGGAALLWATAVFGALADLRVALTAGLLALIVTAAAIWSGTRRLEEVARRTPDRVLTGRLRLLRIVSSVSAAILAMNGIILLRDVVAGRPATSLPAIFGVVSVLGLPLGALGALWSIGLMLGTLDETRRMLGRVLRSQEEAAARRTRNTGSVPASLP